MPVDMKSVISTTVVNMAKEKGVDKITVKSLIEACHISCQSFYYHFQDIMEVIEWSLKQAAQDMLVRSQKAENPEIESRSFSHASHRGRSHFAHSNTDHPKQPCPAAASQSR